MEGGRGGGEGEAGAPGRPGSRGGESFLTPSFLPHNSAPGSACLPAPGKLKFLSHLGWAEKHLMFSAQAPGRSGEMQKKSYFSHKRTQFYPPTALQQSDPAPRQILVSSKGNGFVSFPCSEYPIIYIEIFQGTMAGHDSEGASK